MKLARKIDKWLSDDCKVHDTEVEALESDVKYWKNRALKAENILFDKTKEIEYRMSSYGSSGGGGHD
jgi:hypothetical protein